LTFSRFCSQPKPAAEEIMPIADPRGSLSPSRSSSMKRRCPRKFTLSTTGLSWSTPAQENSACTGPSTALAAASIEARSDRSSGRKVTPGFDASTRSIIVTLAPASSSRSTIAAPMPVAPPTTSAFLPL
jgi:hypothetical protein